MTVDVGQFRRSVSQLVGIASGIENKKIQFVKGGQLPEISGTYSTIKLVNTITLGMPSPVHDSTQVENILDEKIQVATEFQLSVNFYRDGANQHAENMRAAPFRWEVQKHLYQNKLGWVRFGPIRDLTDFFSGWHEERAQADLVLWVDSLDVNQVRQAIDVDITINEPIE